MTREGVVGSASECGSALAAWALAATRNGLYLSRIVSVTSWLCPVLTVTVCES
jgi:hypothetical protein